MFYLNFRNRVKKKTNFELKKSNFSLFIIFVNKTLNTQTSCDKFIILTLDPNLCKLYFVLILTFLQLFQNLTNC